MPRLVVTKGSATGRDHAVTTECVVGRGTDVDFNIEDGNASRRHCRVLVDGAGYAVEDLGSRNGTFVNGVRIQRQAIKDGDVVRVGSTEFVFRQQGLIAPSTAPSARAIVTPPAVNAARTIAVPPVVARPAAPAPSAATPPAAPAPAAATPPAAPVTPPPAPPSPASADAPAPAAPPKPLVAPVPSRKRRTSW